MMNALTIDVEDYYHVAAFASHVKHEDWDNHERRVEMNTYRILDILDANGVKATFFVLGWVAERHPGLVREIDARGHEVASHGFMHQKIYTQTMEEFREDTRKARKVVEDSIGKRLIGYRAASYSITSRCLWAIDVLIEEGFEYDSSIFPIRHDIYGIPGHERFFHILSGNGTGSIAEIPPSTVRIAGMNIPVAGGGYMRLLPYGITERAIRRLNNKDRQPAVVYFHPWEIDPQQPRIKAKITSRLRHYTNIDSMECKLKKLLSSFRFGSLGEIYRSRMAASAETVG